MASLPDRIGYEILFSEEGSPPDEFNLDQWAAALAAASAICHGVSKRKAAEIAGISHTTLYNWMKKDGWKKAMDLARTESHDVVVGKALKAVDELLDDGTSDSERGRMARFVLERNDPQFLDAKYKTFMDKDTEQPAIAQLGNMSPAVLRKLISFLEEGGDLAQLVQALGNTEDITALQPESAPGDTEEPEPKQLAAEAKASRDGRRLGSLFLSGDIEDAEISDED